MKKKPIIKKTAIPEMGIMSFEHQNLIQHYINVYPPKCGDFRLMFEQLTKYIMDNQIDILSQFVFGDRKMQNSDLFNIEDYPGLNKWPVTYIHGSTSSDNIVYGTQLFAVSGVNLTPVCFKGKITGFYYEDNDAAYCYLGDIRPENNDLSNADQTLQVFDNINDALSGSGMDYTNVVRTWFYLDKLFNWYSEFNEVRTKYYRKFGILETLVPASTGIGAGNLQGAPLVSNILAIKPKHSNVSIREVPSPMQCSATDYKSSFSRAVEIKFPDYRQLFISGTASVDNEGRTIFIDNIKEQVDYTMKVIEEIFKSCSMNWDNAVRAIVYLKNIQDIPVFNEFCRKNHLPSFPLCICQSDICREDFLFEIEIDFIKINDDEK